MSQLKKRLLSFAKRNSFPLILLACTVILSGLGISGSSMGAYDQSFYNHVQGIILGHPQPVRSDEWLVNSQMTLTQKKDGFPENNTKIGLGENVSVIIDVPFKSFFALFKPQNLFFFVLPFAQAFAAKWWFMSLALALGFYYLLDTLFPNKKLLISIGSLILLFNPFMQWWYQAATLLTVAYAFWACYFVIKLFGNEKLSWQRLSLYGLGIAYAALSFIFCLYPPYQITTAYVMLAIMIGFFWYRYSQKPSALHQDRRSWLVILAAVGLTAAVTIAFYISHKQVIATILNTAYPGKRNVLSGSPGITANILQTFSSPILFNLQKAARAVHFYTNQSEASRIVPINLALMPFIIYELIKVKRRDWRLSHYLLLTTTLLEGLLLVRMLTPLFNLPFKYLLFYAIPNERLAIGFVLLCVIQLVVIGANYLHQVSLKTAVVLSVIAFAVFADSSHIIASQNPGYISLAMIIVANLLIGVCTLLLLRKRLFMWGLVLFLAFNLASSLFINPMYDRSEPVALQKAAGVIDKHYSSKRNWIALNSVLLENIPLVAGKHSLTGVETYPQLSLWQRLDPKGIYDTEYNRYARVIFTDQTAQGSPLFTNPATDELNITFNCSVAQKLPDLGYVLSPNVMESSLFPCLHISRSIIYPKLTLYIYSYSP